MSSLRKVTIFLCTFALLLVGAIAFLTRKRVNDGGDNLGFERKKLEVLVDAIRLLPFEGSRSFSVKDLADPKSVKMVESWYYTDGTYPLFATRDSLGNLSVFIVTLPGGHSPSYGFVYSDLPVNSSKDAEGDYRLPFPTKPWMTDPAFKVDAHWWKVYENQW